MKLIFLSLNLLLFAVLCSSGDENIEKTKQKILDRLLDPKVYDKRVRPKGNGATNVTVSIFVLDIIDMDEYLKDFTLQCYFRQNWKDERLKMKENETEVRKIRSVDTDSFWQPELFFTNEIRGERHDIMAPNRYVQITPDGAVLVSNRVSVIFSCNSDVKFYPHDEQKCYVFIESYAFTFDELALGWDGDQAVKFNEELSSNSKYALLNHKLTSATVTLNETVYPRLVLELHFARNTHPFLVSIYLPHILLMILSWAAFCIDLRNGTVRLIYLGLIMFLLLKLVPTEWDTDLHVTALDIWTAVCVMFIVSAFLESIFVNQMVNQEDTETVKSQDTELQAMNSGHTNVEKVEKPSGASGGRKILDRLIGKCDSRSRRIDAIFRLVSPVLFLLFNIIYWSVCCSVPKYA